MNSFLITGLFPGKLVTGEEKHGFTFDYCQNVVALKDKRLSTKQ